VALRSLLDHPKFAALKEALGVKKYAALGLLEGVWHFTARFTPAGNIGKYPNRMIAAWVEWEGDPDVLIHALVASGFLDESENYRLSVHDWADWADEFVHAQLARKTERFVSNVLPRTRRLNSAERKKFNEAVAANLVTVNAEPSRNTPSSTSGSTLQSTVQTTSHFSSSAAAFCAVPEPAPEPEPLPEPLQVSVQNRSDQTPPYPPEGGGVSSPPPSFLKNGKTTTTTHPHAQRGGNSGFGLSFPKNEPHASSASQWLPYQYKDNWNFHCPNTKVNDRLSRKRSEEIKQAIGEEGLTPELFRGALRRIKRHNLRSFDFFFVIHNAARIVEHFALDE
jgi:hypothetical protein